MCEVSSRAVFSQSFFDNKGFCFGLIFSPYLTNGFSVWAEGWSLLLDNESVIYTDFEEDVYVAAVISPLALSFFLCLSHFRPCCGSSCMNCGEARRRLSYKDKIRLLFFFFISSSPSFEKLRVVFHFFLANKNFHLKQRASHPTMIAHKKCKNAIKQPIKMQ